MDKVIGFASQLTDLLRTLRKRRGMSQTDLGAKLGVSQVRIANIEADPGKVSVDQLLQVLQALDVNLALRDAPRVITGTGHSSSQASVKGQGGALQTPSISPAVKDDVEW